MGGVPRLLRQVVTFYCFYRGRPARIQNKISYESLGHVAYQSKGVCYSNTMLRFSRKIDDSEQNGGRLVCEL